MRFACVVRGTLVCAIVSLACLLCVLPTMRAGVAAGSATVQRPHDPLMDFTTEEHAHTLRFLRSLATTVPDLAPSWTGDNYCAWTEIHCRGGGITVDLSAVQLNATSSTLPELTDDTDGAQVAVRHLYFYHQGAKLRGSLPGSWARLHRLESLLLVDNHLTGTLPEAWGAAGAMAALRSLMLSLNAFTGTLPASWSSLRGLKTVVLSSSGLAGPLPASWGNLPVLFLVDVSGNRFCGCVPPEWRSSKALRIVADAAVTAANCSSANACAASSDGDWS